MDVHRYGDKVAVTFNCVSEYINTSYISKLGRESVNRSVDAVFIARYDISNLTFTGYDTANCTSTYNAETQLTKVQCKEISDLKQYELIASWNDYTDSYNPLVHPKAIYIDNNISIVCATNYGPFSQNVFVQSVGCTAFDNDKFFLGLPHVAGSEPKWQKYNSTLIALDFYIQKNDFPFISFDIALIKF